MAEPEIIEDSTQTLYSDLPANHRYIPASVTVRVQTPNVTLPTSGDAATIGTTEFNTNAAAEAGERSLSFASGQSVTAGRAYLLFPGGAVAAADVADAFIVRFTDSGGSTLQLAEPLPEDVASGAGIIPWFVSHALTATETAERGLGFAEWTVTDSAGETHLWAQPLRIVLHATAYALDGATLTQMRPLLLTMRPPEDENFVETLDAAWRRVEQLLMADGMEPSRVRSHDMLKDVHADACVLHVLRNSPRADPAFVDQWEQIFRNTWQGTLSGRSFWYDAPEDLSGQSDTQDLSRQGLDFSL